MSRIRLPLLPSNNKDSGSVTAELAVLLPGVVLAIVVILVAASAGVAQVRCADAARAGARAAALGKTDEQVSAIAAELAGDGAEVSVTESGRWVRVRVSTDVPLGPLSGVLTADASFSALPEPTAAAQRSAAGASGTIGSPAPASESGLSTAAGPEPLWRTANAPRALCREGCTAGGPL